MAKGKPWRFAYVENMNIHAFHIFVAHKIDRAKRKQELRNPQEANTIKL